MRIFRIKREYGFRALERWPSIGYVCLCVVMVVVFAEASDAGDWSTWRGDASRSACSTSALPNSLHLQWVRRLEKPVPAWPASQHKIQFDLSYEPVVAGKRIFVGSMVSDRVTAYDTESGKELWRKYVDGPVRFAPLVWHDKVYVVSDDGMLYCLDASTGHPLWVMRGGPDSRMVLGNDRLVSAWPVRGAPVLRETDDGKATLYFAAGIWPFMGIFIHAVDADSGAVIWSNSGSGSEYVLQQHNSPAFAGVAPQGYLSFGAGVLLVVGGRTVPAAYDLDTGKFIYFHVARRAYGKDVGGYNLGVVGESFINRGCVYDLKKGSSIANLHDSNVVRALSVARIGKHFLAVKESGIDLYGTEIEIKEEDQTDRKGKKKRVSKPCLVLQHAVKTDWRAERAHFSAGDRVYLSGAAGRIAAVDLPPLSQPGLSWQGEVKGRVFTMLPGDNKLFVVTEEGALYCFGADVPVSGVARYELKGRAEKEGLSLPGPEGYALVLGLDGDGLKRLPELAQRYHVIVIDPDARRVESARKLMDADGIYGRRVHILAGDPASMELPQYMASRIEISGDLMVKAASGKSLVQRVWRSLRPYGGVAEVRGESGVAAFAKAARAFVSEDGKLQIADDKSHACLTRVGALPGSADWTHENADVANTVVSKDMLVKSPLGLLWFGGPPNDDILPRHGHGPSPQVVGGRLFIEGPDAFRAVDVYTGRLLWQRELVGLGKFYDNTSHQPGANEIGGNYVSMADGVYVVYERKCLRLDPATGVTVSEFSLPHTNGEQVPHWGYIGVYGDLLMAGSTPLLIKEIGKDKPPVVTLNAQYASSSKRLVVLDRHSGQKLWEQKADQVLRHNGIVAGAGKIFCLDGISDSNLKMLKRRGEKPERPMRLLALEAGTGKILWQTSEKVHGTWLGFSEAHDILLEAGSPSRDRASDEVSGHMAAYRGVDGKLLWRATHQYKGRPILHGTTIYADYGVAYDLMTGAIKQLPNRLTGKPTTWSYSRNYGCNTPIAGQHMLLFRSAAAGFYDLASDGGTGNWGGFKSGCTSNLMPADGVLSAPDYTRTCTCSYQNQCSLALVPMDDVEVWTFQSYEDVSGPLQRAGVNFGAPGDWPAPGGTLWLDYPSVGGRSPDLKVRVKGEVRYFRHHALCMTGDARQVTASGLEGTVNVEIPLGQQDTQSYTVRLFFAEPDLGAKANERLFDVYLQGKRVIRALDIFAETRLSRCGLQKEFCGVKAGEELRIELRQRPGSKRLPVLGGIEFIKEKNT